MNFRSHEDEGGSHKTFRTVLKNLKKATEEEEKKYVVSLNELMDEELPSIKTTLKQYDPIKLPNQFVTVNIYLI